MAKIIGLPKLSPTMEEGTLASWAKKEGDAIDVDDLLAEVETDKATMEFRSFDRGVLLKILAPEGSTLKPDQPVAIVGSKGEDIGALLAKAAGTTPPAAAPATPSPTATPAPTPGAKSASGKAKVIGLPKLSPTMEEGTLASWAKKEGDTVEIDDLLAEVETDKATMEFRSFDRGVLLKILAPEGTVLKPDQPVAILGEKGADITGLLEGGGPKAAASPASAAGAAPASAQVEVAAAVPGGSASPAPAVKSNGHARGGRVLASPLVRRIARERAIDLAEVHGSGPHGRIVKRDLEGVAAKPRSATPAAAPATLAREGRLPPVVEQASQMRKAIARRLTESKRDVPHYYLTIDVDAAPLIEARKHLIALLEAGGGDAPGAKVSLNDLMIKACAVALRRMPSVNSSWVNGEIHRHRVVDISVAVSVPDGLVTPVVRDADRKGVAEIAGEVKELAARARAKKLKPEEFTGGTFSISNLGMYGIEEFAAVINPPEGAILAIGAVREEPVVRAGEVVAGKRMKMTLSADHRVIDGALGAEFLKLLRGLLEAPVSMLV